MIRSAFPASYSSDVRLSLRVDEHVLEVAQVDANRCILRDPIELPAGPADLEISVDGKISTETVILMDGVKIGCPEVRFW
ncbi:hypothetical protein CA85_09390 [Allorhodopirellula solitaria]|uniref:Uncharacterized protein n=1 Tax=Allorhodopirellula solitaria TaxID=2527987 RepID=A0A5C5YG02_9BACT|nr:hypothetical protein CA85_09390 [Allorhodopirellula solitaria]